jgi:hypothetical protein
VHEMGVISGRACHSAPYPLRSSATYLVAAVAVAVRLRVVALTMNPLSIIPTQ